MRAVLLSLTAFLAALALAQDPVPLKRVPKEGDTAKYKLTVDTDISGMTIKYTAKTTDKVTKVREDGSFTVTSEQSDQVLNINGQDSPAPAGVGDAASTTYLADGSVQEISGDQADASSYRMANIQILLWPKDAVKVGSKWEADVKADDKKGYPAVHCTYEIAGEEKSGAHETFKIAYECKETAGSDPAGSKGTLWIDKATGLMVRSESVWTNAPIAGQMINGKVVIEIVE